MIEVNGNHYSNIELIKKEKKTLSRTSYTVDDFYKLADKNTHLQKPLKTVAFSRFLGVLVVLLEAMLAHLGVMLGYVGPAGRHLGATWRQDEAQERQDEAR